MIDTSKYTDIINPDNLHHHATARLLYHNGLHGKADWTIVQWRKNLQKQNKSNAMLTICGICEKPFADNDNPYIAEFKDKNTFIGKVICKDCAYAISRNVIESDGNLYNGQQKFPKYKPTPKLIPILEVKNDPPDNKIRDNI